MKKYVISIIIISLFCSCSLAQSILYRNDGKLFVDTTYSIDPLRINEITKFEKYILPIIFNEISYPKFCSDNSIEGNVIVKVKIESDTTVIIDACRFSDIALYKEIEKSLDAVFLQQQSLNYWKIFNQYPIEFYIPFMFEILPARFKTDLIKKKTITIKAFSNTNYYKRISWMSD